MDFLSVAEIHHVLRRGGLLYVSEPVYWGDFNELMRLIHDERDARAAAFQALVAAVEDGLFEPLDEVFLEIPGTYESWEDFAARFLDVTHTDLAIDPPRGDPYRLHAPHDPERGALRQAAPHRPAAARLRSRPVEHPRTLTRRDPSRSDNVAAA